YTRTLAGARRPARRAAQGRDKPGRLGTELKAEVGGSQHREERDLALLQRRAELPAAVEQAGGGGDLAAELHDGVDGRQGAAPGGHGVLHHEDPVTAAAGPRRPPAR